MTPLTTAQIIEVGNDAYADEKTCPQCGGKGHVSIFEEDDNG